MKRTLLLVRLQAELEVLIRGLTIEREIAK